MRIVAVYMETSPPQRRRQDLSWMFKHGVPAHDKIFYTTVG